MRNYLIVLLLAILPLNIFAIDTEFVEINIPSQEVLIGDDGINSDGGVKPIAKDEEDKTREAIEFTKSISTPNFEKGYMETHTEDKLVEVTGNAVKGELIGFHTALALTDPAVSAATANGMAVAYQLSDLALSEEKAFKDTIAENNSAEGKFLADAYARCASESGINISGLNRLSCLGDGESMGGDPKGNKELVGFSSLIEELKGCDYGSHEIEKTDKKRITALHLAFCRADKQKMLAFDEDTLASGAEAMVGDVGITVKGDNPEKIEIITKIVPGYDQRQNNMVKLIRWTAQLRRTDVAKVVADLCEYDYGSGGNDHKAKQDALKTHLNDGELKKRYNSLSSKDFKFTLDAALTLLERYSQEETDCSAIKALADKLEGHDPTQEFNIPDEAESIAQDYLIIGGLIAKYQSYASMASLYTIIEGTLVEGGVVGHLRENYIKQIVGYDENANHISDFYLAQMQAAQELREEFARIAQEVEDYKKAKSWMGQS